MASIQKVRLLVVDSDDVKVMDEQVESIGSGKSIFDTMNSRCGFDKWATAFVSWQGQTCSVYTGAELEQNVKSDMQLFINRLSPGTEQRTFTLEVQKQGDDRSDGSPGPDPVRNPGLRPGRHGPDHGGFETSGGPGVSLARMCGTLARV